MKLTGIRRKPADPCSLFSENRLINTNEVAIIYCVKYNFIKHK